MLRSFYPGRKYPSSLSFAALENRRDCWPNRSFQKESLGARRPTQQQAVARGREEVDARSLGRDIAQVLRSKGTRLVLHFDVNKTLIMVDPAGRKTQSQVTSSPASPSKLVTLPVYWFQALKIPPCNALHCN